jgi:DNA-binding MarR family transcriptional regulator/N-acetylglutamate synthase-like GNAT family acetyltransferase
LTADVIKQLGALAFASRLKRLSERLMQDVSRVYREQDVEFEARWFPVGFLLMQQSPMSVTAIADALGLTHPAVSQIAGYMEKRGLLVSEKDESDERRRLLSLSRKGQQTLEALNPIWMAIERCTRDLIDSSGTDLLTGINEIERQLDDHDMYSRVIDVIKKQQLDEVEILDYAPQYQDYFRDFNLEWLERDFRVEAHDEELLSNPSEHILMKGGHVFFARLDGEIVGTAALLKHNERIYEIAKMAVTERSRGRRVGMKLALAAIEKARAAGAESVLVATSPKLEAANNLYRTLGCADTAPAPEWRSQFQRETIFMKLDLTLGQLRKRSQRRKSNESTSGR